MGVGSATVYIKTDNKEEIPGTNGVMPHINTLSEDNDKIIYVNIFYLFGVVILIALTAVLIIIKSRASNKRHGFGTSKKLHF